MAAGIPDACGECLRIAALAPDLETAAKTNKTPRENLLARARGEPDGIVSFDRAVLGNGPHRPGGAARRSGRWLRPRQWPWSL